MDKYFYFRDAELKSEDKDNRIIRGYAVVFDEPTDRVGFFKEKIDRYAFDGVDLSNVVLIVGHDFKDLLAKNGVNMRMEVDDKGVWFEAKLPDTQLGKDTYELIRSEILSCCSFGFSIEEMTTDYETETDIITRIGKVFELTLTPIPAYPQTVATTLERKQKHQNELKRKEEQSSRFKKLKLLEEI